MKFIDEKGRLLGKVNLLDLLVVLVLAAAAVLLAVKLLTPEQTDKENPVKTVTLITYTVSVKEIQPEIYQGILEYVDPAAGKVDQLISNGKPVNGAYVTECTASPHITYVETADGNVRAVESSGDDRRLDLTFTIYAYVSNTTDNTVGSQDVRIGVKHTIKTAHFELSGGQVQTVVWGEEEVA